MTQFSFYANIRLKKLLIGLVPGAAGGNAINVIYKKTERSDSLTLAQTGSTCFLVDLSAKPLKEA
jgi:hypothetical protein